MRTRASVYSRATELESHLENLTLISFKTSLIITHIGSDLLFETVRTRYALKCIFYFYLRKILQEMFWMKIIFPGSQEE